MSRQLDLQIYLALHGYPLKEIPEERFDDYMREPHYSTDAEAMLELDNKMYQMGWVMSLARTSTGKYVAYYETTNKAADGISNKEPLARALAAYKALTGEEWQD